MNDTFRSQTTELVVAPPFKGKGLVNDRLRFDVSGLNPSITYLLSYNPSTSTFSWSDVDSAGIDTLYSADGTIAEARTVETGENNLTFTTTEGNITLESLVTDTYHNYVAVYADGLELTADATSGATEITSL